MVGSLLQLRNFVGALAGYGCESEPVLYQWELGVGAQWPCGCLACGAVFEFLELVFCNEHYRAQVPRPMDGQANRRMNGDRRCVPRRRRSPIIRGSE
jgi:hypothetical protein